MVPCIVSEYLSACIVGSRSISTVNVCTVAQLELSGSVEPQAYGTGLEQLGIPGLSAGAHPELNSIVIGCGIR